MQYFNSYLFLFFIFLYHFYDFFMYFIVNILYKNIFYIIMFYILYTFLSFTSMYLMYLMEQSIFIQKKQQPFSYCPLRVLHIQNYIHVDIFLSFLLNLASAGSGHLITPLFGAICFASSYYLLINNKKTVTNPATVR